MNWSRELDYGPVETPDGKSLRTLDDARRYLAPMADTEANQKAAGALLMAAEHGGPWKLIAQMLVCKAIYGDAQAPVKRRETVREKRARRLR